MNYRSDQILYKKEATGIYLGLYSLREMRVFDDAVVREFGGEDLSKCECIDTIWQNKQSYHVEIGSVDGRGLYDSNSQPTLETGSYLPHWV